MKKILLAVATVAALALTACGNNDLGFGNFTFRKVHIQMYSMDEPIHLEVDGWQNDDGGIELRTKNHGTILLGDGTYMMYDGAECPICGHVEYR